MDASNVLIAAPNRADVAALSGGAWATPREYVQTRPLRQVARTADTAPANTWLDIALDRVRSIEALGLVRHNLGLTGQLRWQAWRDAAHTDSVYDSGWLDAWPPIWPTSTRRWTDPNWWSGRLLAEELATYPRVWSRVLSPAINARYWRLSLSDPDNAAGWLEIGRLVMATGWRPTYNMSFGVALGWEDSTSITETESGMEVADVRPRRRVATFSLEHLTGDEAYSLVMDTQRALGVWGEVLLCLNPDDQRRILQNTLWGRLRKLGMVSRPDVIRYVAPFDILEIVR